MTDGKPRTAEAHGRLWGERARDWADYQEGTVLPVVDAVPPIGRQLSRAGVVPLFAGTAVRPIG